VIARKIVSVFLATLFLSFGVQTSAWADACKEFDARFATFQKDNNDFESEEDIVKYDNPLPRTDAVLCTAAIKAHKEGSELFTLVKSAPKTYIDCWGKDKYGYFVSGMTETLKGMEGSMEAFNCSSS
jgi:hypothetical protein